jgi:succinate dehydrogenase / fumarate reductase membrane anchor subunit
MVGRAVGGARYGLRDWLAQRVSALLMAIYMVFMVSFVVAHRPLQYGDWKGLFDQAWMRIFSLLFMIGLCIHAWVGMRNIFMDYVHSTGIRLLQHVVVIVALVVYLLWAVQILWSL